MKTIDFLSESPKNFIFNENSNKTFFGGILSLIYLIIVLLITSFYLVNYFISDKYTVEYGFFQEVSDESKRKEMLESEKYNPTTKFAYLITDDKGQIIDNETILLADDYNQTLPTTFTQRISDLNYVMLYKCKSIEDKNCSFDKINNKEKKVNLNLFFRGFKLDHQGEIPLYKSTDQLYSYSSTFYLKNPSLRRYIWKTIKYYENLWFADLFYQIFGIEQENEFIGGNIINSEYYSIRDFNEEILQPFELNNTLYRIAGYVKMDIDFNTYDQYKRTKISFFDVIANICSLSITVLGIFAFCVSNLYSNNYDNFQIVEKILSKDKSKNINKTDNINNDLDKENDKENIINRDSSKSESLLDNSNNERLADKENCDKLININEDERKILPKIRFIDFILNNLTFNKCLKNNSQIMISSCNELISKYYTVEYIIYNQIMFENLLKDYKWNDPSLNNIESNEYISRIKSKT